MTQEDDNGMRAARAFIDGWYTKPDLSEFFRPVFGSITHQVEEKTKNTAHQ
jgi:hypothetical protein